MSNEEFEIAFKQAIAHVGDISNMTLYDPKNPTIYVTKEYYEMIKNRDKFVSVELEYPQPLSVESEILQLKSQLKYCKNYLEKQNIERKLNKLYKERKKE